MRQEPRSDGLPGAQTPAGGLLAPALRSDRVSPPCGDA